jgi:hypothetical protein
MWNEMVKPNCIRDAGQACSGLSMPQSPRPDGTQNCASPNEKRLRSLFIERLVQGNFLPIKRGPFWFARLMRAAERLSSVLLIEAPARRAEDTCE